MPKEPDEIRRENVLNSPCYKLFALALCMFRQIVSVLALTVIKTPTRCENDHDVQWSLTWLFGHRTEEPRNITGKPIDHEDPQVSATITQNNNEINVVYEEGVVYCYDENNEPKKIKGTHVKSVTYTLDSSQTLVDIALIIVTTLYNMSTDVMELVVGNWKENPEIRNQWVCLMGVFLAPLTDSNLLEDMTYRMVLVCGYDALNHTFKRVLMKAEAAFGISVHSLDVPGMDAEDLGRALQRSGFDESTERRHRCLEMQYNMEEPKEDAIGLEVRVKDDEEGMIGIVTAYDSKSELYTIGEGRNAIRKRWSNIILEESDEDQEEVTKTTRMPAPKVTLSFMKEGEPVIMYFTKPVEFCGYLALMCSVGGFIVDCQLEFDTWAMECERYTEYRVDKNPHNVWAALLTQWLRYNEVTIKEEPIQPALCEVPVPEKIQKYLDAKYRDEESTVRLTKYEKSFAEWLLGRLHPKSTSIDENKVYVFGKKNGPLKTLVADMTKQNKHRVMTGDLDDEELQGESDSQGSLLSRSSDESVALVPGVRTNENDTSARKEAHEEDAKKKAKLRDGDK